VRCVRKARDVSTRVRQRSRPRTQRCGLAACAARRAGLPERTLHVRPEST
jgi:hypothetical protein